MRRLKIALVEPYVGATGGHYLARLRGAIEAFERLGIQIEVFVPRKEYMPDIDVASSGECVTVCQSLEWTWRDDVNKFDDMIRNCEIVLKNSRAENVLVLTCHNGMLAAWVRALKSLRVMDKKVLVLMDGEIYREFAWIGGEIGAWGEGGPLRIGAFFKPAFECLSRMLKPLRVYELFSPIHAGFEREPSLSEKKYVLFPGGMRGDKGPECLIRLIRGFPEEEFVVSGILPSSRTVYTLRRLHALREQGYKVKILTRSLSMLEYLKVIYGAKIGVLPHAEFAFHVRYSSTLKELIAAGAVPIVRKGTWLEWFCRWTGAGCVCFEEGDIVEALRAAIDGWKDLAERSLKASRFVRENLTWDRFARKVISIFREW